MEKTDLKYQLFQTQVHRNFLNIPLPFTLSVTLSPFPVKEESKKQKKCSCN